MSSDRELSQLMKTLSQELFDYIYDLTFTAVPGIRFIGKMPVSMPDLFIFSNMTDALAMTDPHYEFVPTQKEHETRLHELLNKPDSVNLLHVDRASRTQFAKSFLSDEKSCFVYHQDGYLEAFLSRLDAAHIRLLRNARKLSLDSTFATMVVDVSSGVTEIDSSDFRRPVRRACKLADLAIEDCMSSGTVELLGDEDKPGSAVMARLLRRDGLTVTISSNDGPVRF